MGGYGVTTATTWFSTLGAAVGGIIGAAASTVLRHDGENGHKAMANECIIIRGIGIYVTLAIGCLAAYICYCFTVWSRPTRSVS
jgi:hypothetical protein